MFLFVKTFWNTEFVVKFLWIDFCQITFFWYSFLTLIYEKNIFHSLFYWNNSVNIHQNNYELNNICFISFLVNWEFTHQNMAILLKRNCPLPKSTPTVIEVSHTVFTPKTHEVPPLYLKHPHRNLIACTYTLFITFKFLGVPTMRVKNKPKLWQPKKVARSATKTIELLNSFHIELRLDWVFFVGGGGGSGFPLFFSPFLYCTYILLFSTFHVQSPQGKSKIIWKHHTTLTSCTPIRCVIWPSFKCCLWS